MDELKRALKEQDLAAYMLACDLADDWTPSEEKIERFRAARQAVADAIRAYGLAKAAEEAR